VSVQRRRGMPARIWPQRLAEDRRGSAQYTADMAAKPYEVTAALIPQRGSRAEVPGQQQIVVYSMIFHPAARDVELTQLSDIGLWSRVLWNGAYYDVVSPPVYHHGTRVTRHWSMDVRERPERVAS
jgi:hypothetical protein